MAKSRKPKVPRTKGDRHGISNEAIVLIPLTYNDGTNISEETIKTLFKEIYVAFQGWTLEGTVEGAYRMQTGGQRVEELLKVSVVLDELQIPQLEAMVARWCANLKQEVMLMKVTDVIVKFIPPQREGG
jgi:hypothetical protein